MPTIQPLTVLIAGDSTIDNRIWLGKEKYLLYLGTSSPFLSTLVNFIAWFIPFKAKSVVENLRSQMPQIKFVDRANDGFTTSDVLNGAFRDKVFGIGAHRFFPHQFFKPLECAEIKSADKIILSIGGNNFREFIQSALSMRNENRRKEYITHEYPKVFQKMQAEYQEILKKIASLNPNADIVLMTQYYPALNQKTLLGTSIYDFMSILGSILDKGNAEDTIVEVMKESYHGILKFIASEPLLSKRKIAVVDVTSSLNPHSSDNYVGQIEPSDAGGRKIAQMLSYVIQQNTDHTQEIYRFSPGFFTSSEKDAHVHTCTITPETAFIPVHPSKMLKNTKDKFQADNDSAYRFNTTQSQPSHLEEAPAKTHLTSFHERVKTRSETRNLTSLASANLKDGPRHTLPSK